MTLERKRPPITSRNKHLITLTYEGEAYHVNLKNLPKDQLYELAHRGLREKILNRGAALWKTGGAPAQEVIFDTLVEYVRE